MQREPLEPPDVSEDVQSPPEEGDFVLDGRTLVKWTLQQGQDRTRQEQQSAIFYTPTSSFNFKF